jgi:hypothetical protein
VAVEIHGVPHLRHVVEVAVHIGTFDTVAEADAAVRKARARIWAVSA